VKGVIRVNDHELEARLLNMDGWIAVAFLYPDSQPCLAFAPEYAALADALDHRAVFLSVDAQENPSVTEERRVRAVPTTLLFRDGDERGRWEGPYSRDALLERVAGVMDGKGKK